MEVFCVYLVLIAKPRIDVSGFIECKPTLDECAKIAISLIEHNQFMLAGKDATYTWVCSKEVV
jgi:hypothetical protein